MKHRDRRRAVPLRPLEVAMVAIFGGLAVAAIVVAAVIPMATAVGLLAPVPLALVAARTRPRAFVAATVAAAAVAFAMAGTGAAAALLSAALIGGIVGDTRRRGRGLGTIIGVGIVAGPLIGGFSVLVLLILKPLRELVLAAMKNSIEGAANVLRAAGAGDDARDAVAAFGHGMVTHWWIWVWAMGTISTLISLAVAWWLLGDVLRRLDEIPSVDTLTDDPDVVGTVSPGADVPPGPLPATMTGVGFRYHPDAPPALSDIDLTIGEGEFIAVVGANGSGKSTLAKILAGRTPTDGVVRRPGAPALGQSGGTAMVLQRPETQMLGSRVADDIVWGLPPEAEVDVDAVLAEVGLDGLAGRETSDLSGGQQQRLAIAAALVRRPALLIADEVTSMVDPAGRAEVLDLLAGLPEAHGITVVLITHREEEATAADRVIHLSDGRIAPQPPAWIGAPGPGRPERQVASRPAGRYRPTEPGEPIITLDGVGHTYLAGSPWEVTALHDVSLTVRRGDGLLIVGGNGSGKTTLAWILAGLLTPSAGRTDLRGKPIHERVGSVGLAFQHARLQLQRAAVGDEIMSAGGPHTGTADVAQVLERVGLPREMAARQVDSLSGGQMRRVALAALLAHRPQVLVLDEPLAGLDPGARQEVIALLARLRADGHALVIISHDYEMLDTVCDRQIALAGGTLQPDGARHETSAPASAADQVVAHAGSHWNVHRGEVGR